MSPARTKLVRRAEARAAARILGATHHRALWNDLEILYEVKTLRRLAAIIREVEPTIILTHSPQDYMEDHTNTSRLVVSAAFARGMPNFRTAPNRKPTETEVTIYHGLPHGLRDQLRRRIVPEVFVNTAAVHATKRAALAAHVSQKAWLDATQGMGSYLAEMDATSRAVGKMSGPYDHAEGWRRHLHLGFSAREIDPLSEALSDSVKTNPKYSLEAE